MKKTVLFFGAFALTSLSWGQTTLFSENFESGGAGFTLNTTDQGGTSGTTGDNYWIVNNDYTGGSGTSSCFGASFTIGASPAQPAGISNQNGNYMHIMATDGANNGIYNAHYVPADNALCFFNASHFAAMNTDVNTTGMTNTTVDFWWLNVGSNNAIGEVYYSTDMGTTWTMVTGTSYFNQGTWTQESLTDAAWDNQATLRFGIRFYNHDAASGSDPALSIDDFEISATASCMPTSSSFSETACFEYTVPSGDETYTTPGTATVMDTIPNVAGCDSVMTITYTINTVDASMTNNGYIGTANSSTGTYQWIGDCNNTDTVITGETNQSIDISNGLPNFGDYAVIVTDNGCTDTSNCEVLGYGSIGEINQDFVIYPNPSQGIFSIDLSNFNGIEKVDLLNVEGKVIMTYADISQGAINHFELDEPEGIYIVRIMRSDGHISRSKLIIE